MNSRLCTCYGLAAAAMLIPATTRSQSALHFTLPYGSFAVGFRTVDQYDYARSFGGEFDADGRPRTGERARPIQTSVWYPAASSAGSPMHYGEYLELIVAPGALPSRDAAVRAAAAQRLAHAFAGADDARTAREANAPTHAIRDASAAAGPFPVIVYGASLGAPSFENAKLMEYLASFGYIVVASPSFGAQGPQSSDAVGLEAEARDMEFLIAYARQVPGADNDRVAVMGFSWGGLASVLVALRNPSVKAVVSLDGSIAYFYHRMFAQNPEMNVARFTVPALFLKQRPPSDAIKTTLGPDSVFDFFKDVKYSDATLVTFNTLAHQNFGEWFDRLSYLPGPALVADTLVQSAGYEHIASYVRHFLDASLKHDPEGEAFLRRSPAENGVRPSEITIERRTGLRPLPSLPAFAAALRARGESPSEAPAYLSEIRRSNPDYSVAESDINAWGRRLLAAKQVKDAVGVFQFYAALFPQSGRAFEQLGEAQEAGGQRAAAIDSFVRAAELNPGDSTAATHLRKLRGG